MKHKFGIKIIATIAAVASLTWLSGCATSPSHSTVRTKQGALLGAGAGAVTGAIIGHQKGRELEGAAIGAGVGAIGGGVLGNSSDDVINGTDRHFGAKRGGVAGAAVGAITGGIIGHQKGRGLEGAAIGGGVGAIGGGVYGSTRDEIRGRQASTPAGPYISRQPGHSVPAGQGTEYVYPNLPGYGTPGTWQNPSTP